MENRSPINTLVGIVFTALVAAVPTFIAEDRNDYALWCGAGAFLLLMAWVNWAFRLPRLDSQSHGGLRTIVKAEYGTHTDRKDVMPYMRDNVRHGVLAMMVTSEALGGDPFPGEAKTLYITLRRGLKTEDHTYKDGVVFQLFGMRNKLHEKAALPSPNPLR